MPVLYFSLRMLGTTLAFNVSQELKAETFYYCASPFAESTKATYKSQRDSNLRFCTFVGYNPIPARFQLVLLSYLSMLPFWLDHLKFFQLKPIWVLYLYYIRSSVCLTLSLIIGLLNLFHLVLKRLGGGGGGGGSVKQKLPITVDILSRVHKSLNFKNIRTVMMLPFGPFV